MEEHVAHFKKSCRLSEYLSSSVVYLNTTTSRLQTLKYDKRHKINFRKFCTFSALLVCGIFYGQWKKSFTALEQMLQALTVAEVLSTSAWIISARNNVSSICIYVNGLFALSRQNGKSNQACQTAKNLSFFAKMNIRLAYALYPFLIGFPIVYVYGVHLLFPCNPSLSGYFLNPSCWGSGEQSKNPYFILKIANCLIKYGLLLLNHWMWSFLVNIVGVLVSAILMLGSVTFGQAISRLVKPSEA